MSLPLFRYHPDPLGSGSVVASGGSCRCCGQARGYLYAGPVYAEAALDDALCPWCIADGSAHDRFHATFVDEAAFGVETPAAAIAEVSQRTPGYSSWQGEEWPACCGDATAFLAPAGATELNGALREFQGSVLNHIIYGLRISGGAATRLLGALDRDQGPTAYLFRCLTCGQHHVHVDQP
jgi:uncharacterized protein CbrC (UPF0167 family)